MRDKSHSFGKLFKKFRLKAEFYTLSEFAEALALEGFVYEDSIFSHWQKNNRIPKSRNLILTIIKIFINKGGITSIKEANLLLESAKQGDLMDLEVEYVTSSFDSLPKPSSAKKMVKFASMIGRSKRILRSGWVREKIKDPESVAEHSFRLSVLAMVLADQLGVDKEKLIQMAILHDLGEVITGDVVWSRGSVIDMRKKAEKEELEKKGIGKIFKLIERSNNYVGLFEEMIGRKTQEAKIFWQLDKLEMAIQAMEYEKNHDKKIEEFFINADLQIYSPLLRKIFKEVVKQRIV